MTPLVVAVCSTESSAAGGTTGPAVPLGRTRRERRAEHEAADREGPDGGVPGPAGRAAGGAGAARGAGRRESAREPRGPRPGGGSSGTTGPCGMVRARGGSGPPGRASACSEASIRSDGTGPAAEASASLTAALGLELVAAGGAVGDVGEGAVAGLVAELAVDEGGDAGAEVAHGDRLRRPGSHGRRRRAGGARCSSAARSWARPRWMRLRTVPSLMPSVAAISS